MENFFTPEKIQHWSRYLGRMDMRLHSAQFLEHARFSSFCLLIAPRQVQLGLCPDTNSQEVQQLAFRKHFPTLTCAPSSWISIFLLQLFYQRLGPESPITIVQFQLVVQLAPQKCTKPNSNSLSAPVSMSSWCPCLIYWNTPSPGGLLFDFSPPLAIFYLYWSLPPDQFSWYILQTSFYSCLLLSISTANTIFQSLIITVAQDVLIS